MADIPIQCRCGNVEGIAKGLSPQTGNHLICYCDDCQAFARFLRDDLLDDAGGSELFQTSQARISLFKGKLASLVLTDNSQVLRWYAPCCNTPIGNTLRTGGLPFIGLCCHSLQPPGGKAELLSMLGPIKAKIFTTFARQPLPDGGHCKQHKKVPVTMMLGIFAKMLLARLKGEHKQGPFFNPQSGQANAPCHVLTADERARVYTPN